MTRETKIGLLVGLGFIVVFAVLLSHSGSGPSPTQNLTPIARNSPESSPPQSGGGATPTTPLVSDIGGGHPTGLPQSLADIEPQLRDPISDEVASAGTANELPSPRGFEPSTIISSTPSGNEGSVRDGLAMAGTEGMGLAEPTRVMPPVVVPAKPVPAERPVEPATTALPEDPPVDNALVENAAGAEPSNGMAHAVTPPAKPYLVHKGDTLVKITKELYGKSTPEVISFVVDANKGTIKDRDSLREGQTIVTPPLPADMFEQRTVRTASSADMKKVQHLLDEAASSDRRVPQTGPDDKAGKKGASADPKALKVGKPSLPVGQPAEFIPVGAVRPTDGPAVDKAASDKPESAKADAKTAESKTGKPDAHTDKKDGKDDKTGQPGKPKGKPPIRTYEIQPKDTFCSIAERELGSQARWVEIKQMNKDIDPTKMKPGMKIRIPSRDPLAGDASLKRASA